MKNINFDKIDAIIAELKKDWGDEWEGRLFRLCSDCGEGSLYQQVLPETQDEAERDELIAAVDEYIKTTYAVEV